MPTRTLSPEEFEAIKNAVLDAAPAGIKEADFNRYIGPAMEQAVGTAENSPAPVTGSTAGRFVAGVWKMVNPMGLVEGASHPGKTLKAIIDAHADQLDKAKASYEKGEYVQAAAHLGGAALPVIGPIAAQTGERLRESIATGGDVAGGVGEAAGLVGSMAVPRLIPKAIRGTNALATKVATSPGAQQAIGATAGAIVGAGAKHPYIGMAIGSKYGAPVVRSAAELAETMTGGRAAAPVEAPLSDLELARREAAAGRLSPQILARMERAVAAKTPPSAAPAGPTTTPPSSASPPETPPPTTPSPAPQGIELIGPKKFPINKVLSELAIQARRASIKLLPEEEAAAVDAVKQGLTEKDAVATIVQQRLAQALPGVMSNEQVQAEIAARVNNRSPKRLADYVKPSGNPFR